MFMNGSFCLLLKIKNKAMGDWTGDSEVKWMTPYCYYKGPELVFSIDSCGRSQKPVTLGPGDPTPCSAPVASALICMHCMYTRTHVYTV